MTSPRPDRLETSAAEALFILREEISTVRSARDDDEAVARAMRMLAQGRSAKSVARGLAQYVEAHS